MVLTRGRSLRGKCYQHVAANTLLRRSFGYEAFWLVDANYLDDIAGCCGGSLMAMLAWMAQKLRASMVAEFWNGRAFWVCWRGNSGFTRGGDSRRPYGVVTLNFTASLNV